MPKVGRKGMLTVVVLAIAVGATALKGDVPANLLTLLGWVFSAFVVGNGVEHAMAAISNRPARTDAGTVEEIKAHAQATNQSLDVVQRALGMIVERLGPKR